jgi:hypothetical protein
MDGLCLCNQAVLTAANIRLLRRGLWPLAAQAVKEVARERRGNAYAALRSAPALQQPRNVTRHCDSHLASLAWVDSCARAVPSRRFGDAGTGGAFPKRRFLFCERRRLRT